uniref:Pc77, similar to salivary kazal-type proteinase inhibitor n=1 Tax=Panstrongylus chinai TaxID=156444 RepID=A0A286T341_9HEMI|nr:Pc77, similar to salivary kazal-type proteinase inhibitor [Panstrongylus chinai]
MKLSTSVLSVLVIAVFLTVCMFDFSEAISCSEQCPWGAGVPVCGQRSMEKKTFTSKCHFDYYNQCVSGGWVLLKYSSC